MKTAAGRIVLLAFLLLVAALLFLPMRAGQEDSLLIEPDVLKISVGGSYPITCRLSSDDTNQRISFSTSDERVAVADTNGTVRALASGEATITATASGGAKAEMRVAVAGTPMRELSLNVDSLYIDKGEISGLSASYNTDATDARLQWVSADESIARVSQNGRILGTGGGETTVSVLSPSGMSASARVFVNVDSTAVHIRPNDLIVGVGAEVPLKISCLPTDSTDTVRRWTSSDPAVATVDADGVLRAVGQGSVYISVLTEDGQTDGMEVTVEKGPADLQLDPSRATLERGDEIDMHTMFYNADGTVDTDVKHLVVWKSTDSSVASVDQNGRVTALKSGSTEITATSDGFTAVCSLKVVVSVYEIRLERTEDYLLREQTGEPIALHYVIDPIDADIPDVTFTSDNEQVASVSADGVVTLTGGYGTAVITASNVSGAQATYTVNVVTQLPTENPEDEFYTEDSYGSLEDFETQTETQSDAAEPAATAVSETAQTIETDDMYSTDEGFDTGDGFAADAEFGTDEEFGADTEFAADVEFGTDEAFGGDDALSDTDIDDPIGGEYTGENIYG